MELTEAQKDAIIDCISRHLFYEINEGRRLVMETAKAIAPDYVCSFDNTTSYLQDVWGSRTILQMDSDQGFQYRFDLQEIANEMTHSLHNSNNS